MNIASWLKETIVIAQPDGTRTDSGEPGYGANANVAARVERRDKLIRDMNGNEINITHAIATDQEIGMQAKIWLPEQTPASDPPHKPVKVEASPDKNSNYVVYHTYIGDLK